MVWTNVQMGDRLLEWAKYEFAKIQILERYPGYSNFELAITEARAQRAQYLQLVWGLDESKIPKFFLEYPTTYDKPNPQNLIEYEEMIKAQTL